MKERNETSIRDISSNFRLEITENICNSSVKREHGDRTTRMINIAIQESLIIPQRNNTTYTLFQHNVVFNFYSNKHADRERVWQLEYQEQGICYASQKYAVILREYNGV